MKKYWYKTTVFYCPLCSSERKYRERMPLPKPTKTWEFHASYDYCDM